jgi:hypothetical protein
MNRSRLQRVANECMLVALAAGILIPVGHAYAAAPLALPAPVAGVQPTIQLSVASAKPGESVEVSGQGVAPYPGVRVVWLDERSSASAAESARQPFGAYAVTIRVPENALPGAARICAAVTGTPEAAFACAGFTKLRARMPLPLGMGRGPKGAPRPTTPSEFVTIVNCARLRTCS